MLKLIIILLTFNNAFGDSCPFLNVTHKNLFESLFTQDYDFYRYKEVDSVIMSPFYGIGDTSSVVKMVQGLIKVSCKYIGSQNTNSSLKTVQLILNRIRFGQNLKDNRIKLNYSENPGEIFCGAVAKMKEIWLIDHLPCFISLYGCQMAKINGESKKFEGVLIFRNGYLFPNKKCSYADLNYTYDVLQKQTGIAQSSLSNGDGQNNNMSRNYCLIELAQQNFCNTFVSGNYNNSINTVYFVCLSVGVGIMVFSFIYVKCVGLDVLL